MNSLTPLYNDELYHYGVKGMHWGIRRYQPYPKGYNGDGKFVGRSKKKVGSFGKKKQTYVRKTLSDDEKTYLVRRGSVDDINNYIDQLSTDQMRDAYNRLVMESNLRNLKGNEFASKRKRIANAVGDTAKIVNGSYQLASLGYGLYKGEDAFSNINRAAASRQRASIGGIKDDLDNDREAKKRKILKGVAIGAGVAAGLGAGALVGRKIYKNHTARGLASVQEATNALNNATSRFNASSKEAANIAKGLKAERAGIINEKLRAQSDAFSLNGKKGIRAAFKRRKNAKVMSSINERLKANAAAANSNAWALGEDGMKKAYAQRGLDRVKVSAEALKKLGARRAVAAGTGLTLAGAGAGLGASKLIGRRRENENEDEYRIGGLSDFKRPTFKNVNDQIKYENYKRRINQNDSKKRKEKIKKIAKGVAIGAGVAGAGALLYKKKDDIKDAVKYAANKTKYGQIKSRYNAAKKASGVNRNFAKTYAHIASDENLLKQNLNLNQYAANPVFKSKEDFYKAASAYRNRANIKANQAARYNKMLNRYRIANGAIGLAGAGAAGTYIAHKRRKKNR